MDEREAAEWNAVAWLKLTDDELIERSASLELSADLHPRPHETNFNGHATGRLHTPAELETARGNADANARGHAGDEFVDAWIKENR